MIKPKDIKELVTTLLKRSQCAVQVAAAIEDGWGIYSWGWNSSGRDGYGQHAEHHAIERANRNRMSGGVPTIYVAARRNRNGRVVTAKPCPECQRLIDKWELKVIYRDGNGVWIGNK